MTGAIIGDVCFIESWISCPASVTVTCPAVELLSRSEAREDVEVIALPSRSLLDAMASYPGMASIYVSRSRVISAILQKSLTRPADVLCGMKLFHGLNPSFIRALANITERKMNFLGDVFKAGQGPSRRCLFLRRRKAALTVPCGTKSLAKSGSKLIAKAETRI